MSDLRVKRVFSFYFCYVIRLHLFDETGTPIFSERRDVSSTLSSFRDTEVTAEQGVCIVTVSFSPCTYTLRTRTHMNNYKSFYKIYSKNSEGDVQTPFSFAAH